MARKDRIRVVFDTNTLTGKLLSRSRLSPNRRVYDLWLLRRELQLIISPAILSEYLAILQFLDLSQLYFLV